MVTYAFIPTTDCPEVFKGPKRVTNRCFDNVETTTDVGCVIRRGRHTSDDDDDGRLEMPLYY